MSERATPFYCPYCGDEDLRPHDTSGEAVGGSGGSSPLPGHSPHTAWLCSGCRRVFTVKMVGLNLVQEAAVS